MKTIVFFMISFVLFVSACKSKKNASDSNAKALTNPEAVVEENISEEHSRVESAVKVVIPEIKIVEILPKETDAFIIKSATIEGDILILDVTYTGGCATHSFDLFTDLKYAKSLPPKMNLFLVHQANQDSCEAMRVSKLHFYIKKIRHEKSSSVVINLNQYKGQITYKY